MMSDLLPVTLASSSVYRKQQLDALKIAFDVISPDIDEQVRPNETPAELVSRLAVSKAQKVKCQVPVRCVIGADQVCTYAGKIYGKPGNRENAIKQLQFFSNKRVQFLTAVCVIDPKGFVQSHIDTTVVQFRSLTLTEITRYIEKEQPFYCAGSFKVESLGLSLFETVESKDPSALMGLPLIALCGFLRQLGFQVP